ncbi:zinc finger protein 26 [Drosophila eugracilis]|uniref:zinc finger protein 26 n=1 Tax=Drosophila eugracilis TaxID=29029 RepID=UPI0007E7A98A|nr:zinc finger protein 26 [Drosophila eugracilis]
MEDGRACKLCRDNKAKEIDLEKPKFKSANNLLQKLFEYYKIDIAILGDSSCLCEPCFYNVLHISESLEKWSSTHEEIQVKPLEIDDSNAFQVKLEEFEDEIHEENKAESPDEYETEMQEEEGDDLSGQDNDLDMTEKEPSTPWTGDFFSVGLDRDGLAICKFFNDKTKTMRILCTCCNQVLEILALIRIHISKPRLNPTYYCRDCCSDFPSLCELKTHIRMMGHFKNKCGGKEMEFLCLKCHKLFPKYFEVLRHENSDHGSMDYICRYCNKRFKTRRNYEKHQRDHNPKLERQEKYECGGEGCNRTFRKWERYEAHMRSHKPHYSQCPYVGCNTELSPRNLKDHIRSHVTVQAERGHFLTLDPLKREEPDQRKVPYGKHKMHNLGIRFLSEVPAPHFSDGGQFISLPKQLSLQQGKYINCDNKS